ncbi:MAG: hypothetical protein WAO98_10265 [Alphaproteobacteria bacterium]
MYLLVFVTLVISMIGVYVQVLSLQTARIAAQQNGIAQAMLAWHSAATSMAGSIIRTNNAAYAAVAATGCGLTFNIPAGATYARCPTPRNGLTALNAWGTLTDGGTNPNLYNIFSTQNTVELVHLPAGYDTRMYQFYSVLYQTGGQNYVATFIPASAAVNQTAFLTMARGNMIGLTASDLIQQLQQSGAPRYTYGTVNTAGQMTTALGTASVQYTLPAFTNTNGAVAVIGTPDGF